MEPLLRRLFGFCFEGVKWSIRLNLKTNQAFEGDMAINPHNVEAHVH
jgi:hypothetical protein